MNFLFAVLDWGLGHATRSLPLIRGLLEKGNKVTILGSGRSLDLLRDEFPECVFILLPEYPNPYSGKGFSLARALFQSPKFLRVIKKEEAQMQNILAGNTYDRIISDSRYGIYSPDIPSYLITHQLRFITPGRLSAGEYLTERFNQSCFRNFRAIIVPDYEQDGLSGDLSHNLHGNKAEIHYIGQVTDVRKKKTAGDIDYFITLSGPEPQRSAFEKEILKQIDSLEGRVIMALAKPGDPTVSRVGNAVVHAFMSREKQRDCLNRARLVISRSGYTTLMELAELGKKALLIPTPGQTEQEYLGRYNHVLGRWWCVDQDKLELDADAEKAAEMKGYRAPSGSELSVSRFLDIVIP